MSEGITIKKDTAYIILGVCLVGGFALGRITGAPSAAAPAAPAAAPAAPSAAPAAPQDVALAPAAPANNAAPAPAAAATPPPAPAPAPAAKPAAPKLWGVRMSDDDITLGPDDAPVKCMVFTSYGCGACNDFEPNVDKAIEKYGKKVQFRYKHKTMPFQHPDAVQGSEAMLAAHAQGKFKAFHDKVMASPMRLGRGVFEEHAKAAGLNIGKFKKALDKETYRGKVLRDSLHAFEVGAHSYPNVLCNGVRIAKPKGWEQLVTLIDGEIKRAEDKLAAGTKQSELYAELTRGGKTFPQMETTAIQTDTTNSPALGPAKGKEKVELVVFEDFQCPFCSKLAPNVKLFAKRFPKEVRVVYKHLPLTSIHADAQLASEASMAAYAQGKFWEYHDLLYANQQALGRADLERYAQQLGLDMSRFKADLDNGTHKAAIDKDVAEARRAGISGTPSVYLNGRKYAGPRGYPPEGLEAVSRAYFGL